MAESRSGEAGTLFTGRAGAVQMVRTMFSKGVVDMLAALMLRLALSGQACTDA